MADRSSVLSPFIGYGSSLMASAPSFLTLFVDGGSRGNPGPSGVGVVLKDQARGAGVHEAGYFLGTTTNNVAEYRGLLKGLEVALAMGAERIAIRSDSQLMVEQVNGRWKVKHANLQPLRADAVALLGRFKWWEMKYVPREENREADGLANKAMDAKADVVLVERGERKATAAPPAGAAGGEGGATLPCFTAMVRGKAKTCLAGTGAGSEYTFGPTTPEGFCIHAAAAALSDGPLQWPGGKRTGETRCKACGQMVQLHRLA